MDIKFISLGSGSSGNCYYIGTDEYSILIDSGIGIRTIKRVLKENKLDFTKIEALFVTHDHADHIKTAGCLGEKYGIPVYSTATIHNGIERSYCVTQKLKTSACIIEKEKSVQIEGFTVTAFEVPHDGSDNVGYCVEIGGKTFSFLTDIGHITSVAAKYISKANYLIMEANYDEEMLEMGPYPKYLKDRIRGGNGHLSNKETADFLCEHFNDRLKHIWLCHLSKDNNHPELAFKTVEMSLQSKGVVVGKDVCLTTLKRTIPSELYIL